VSSAANKRTYISSKTVGEDIRALRQLTLMLHNSKDLGFRTTNRVDRLFGTSAIVGSSAGLDEARILAGPEGKYMLGWVSYCL
jgi:hypothetical protein